jgi:hypothetical protein
VVNRGSRKYRPPLTTAEIHAYNLGRRTHDDGLLLDAVYPGGLGPLLPGWNAADDRDLARLGRDGFSRWAVKGWLDRSREAVG